MSRVFVTWIGGREGRVEILHDGPEGVRARVAVGEVVREVRFERRPRHGGGQVVALADGRSVTASVRCSGEGQWEVALGGHRLEIRAATELDAWLGAGAALAHDNEVVVRMPGRVVKVLVRAGDVVAVGQTLLVIEAMKMENEVKATRAGKVSAVHVAAGDSVESGQPLLELGDAHAG